jgi:hypothetical protein
MKNKYQFIFSVFLLSVLQSSIAAGQDHKDSIILSLKPKECVVFKEGDKCYASVKVKWNASEPAALCLFRNPDEVKLYCWSNASEGQFSEDLVMEEPVDYYLAYAVNSEILIKQTLTLSWVYKKSSRPEQTWRLF